MSYFFSVLLLVAAALPAKAQSKQVKIAFGDTIKHRFQPTGIRFGVDAIALAKSNITKNWRGWEANADVGFWRYFLTAEYGNWSRHETLSSGVFSFGTKYITTGLYSNNGNYLRVGADFNFMMKERQRNMFFMGFRYGMSRFDEHVAYSYTEPSNPTGFSNSYTVSSGNSGTRAHWVELTSGLRVKIWGPFWMGYVARLKFGISVKGEGAMHAFDIPGYGLAEKGTTWGINYQVMCRIPFSKTK